MGSQSMENIPFNKPHVTSTGLTYIQDVIKSSHLCGNGKYTSLCQKFLAERFKFQKCLLTTSCTDALEMGAILSGIEPGDEVIMPSYTFVSTANAFALRGAKIVFADSYPDHPNINAGEIEGLITKKTKAIVPVHYGGAACDMDRIMGLAEKYSLIVTEDAAQALDSYYKKQPLGGIGHFGTFSFHETKNITSGEGGALAVNDKRFAARAEIIWEKGTNRSAFFRGEVDKYGWVDVGSSYLPSEITAAFLYAQLEQLNKIQEKRKSLWKRYEAGLAPLAGQGYFELPRIPEYATNNAHVFYLVARTAEDRTNLISHLKKNGVQAVFHYLSLHKSPFYKDKHDGRILKNADRFTDSLVRLPLYYDLKSDQAAYIVDLISTFYKK